MTHQFCTSGEHRGSESRILWNAADDLFGRGLESTQQMQLCNGMRIGRMPKLLLYVEAFLLRQLHFEDASKQSVTVAINDDEIAYLAAT